MTEYEMKVEGLLAACDKRQLAVMVIEARADERALRAQLAEAQETDEELEWLGDYLFSLTGDLWPQNETTEELNYRLFRNGRDDMRTAIREEIADRKIALAGEEKE